MAFKNFKLEPDADGIAERAQQFGCVHGGLSPTAFSCLLPLWEKVARSAG